MRAARKRSELTQQSVAARLGISQGALSKIENGILIPSAPQWFEFCEMTSISPDSLTAGYIDNGTSAVLMQKGSDLPFKMPRAYLENRGSKVRAMLPFLAYFRSLMGEEKLEEYLKANKIDPDFFVQMDNQISLAFCLDISRFLISKGYFKPEDFPKLKEAVVNPTAHGRLHRSYEATGNAANLISVLLRNSKQYECNFSYSLEEQGQQHLVLSVAPEAHLAEFDYKNDPVLGDFLCRYKKYYFESFASYGDKGSASVREVQCHYKGADRCVYHLDLAS